jgi:hypothetical protein
MSNEPTIHPATPPGAINPGNVPEELERTPVWSDELVANTWSPS